MVGMSLAAAETSSEQNSVVEVFVGRIVFVYEGTDNVVCNLRVLCHLSELESSLRNQKEKLTMEILLTTLTIKFC